jgi:dihydroorotate dehydrogenase subfamily 2
MKKVQIYILSFLILVGLTDSVFLTYEHYVLTSIGCPVSTWINCLVVTTSKYSEIFGIPLALLGVIYYMFLGSFLYFGRSNKMFRHFYIITSSFGVLFSLYLIGIQMFAIKLFCLYCLLSAFVSFFNFGFTLIFFEKDFKTLVLDCFGYAYKYLLKPILFLFDAEAVHEWMVKFGENLPKPILILFKKIFGKYYKNLVQNIVGVNFKSPIGLAAGFDYEARLTKILPNLGFGFGTIGTLSYSSYEGNPKPMLGRLPNSKSLLVNKGFKNFGIHETLKKFNKSKFRYPVGISVGRTNSSELDTVDKTISDIVKGFKEAKKINLNNAYYELNISCPNLIHSLNIDFYDLKNLEKLLSEIDKLKIKKPIFVKMPIDQTEKHTLSMLKIIAKHKIVGVIFGNLQTNKKHRLLDKDEVKKFKMGKYSGKPTFEDSNIRIKLAYKNFKDRFVIVGTGGVFNADDAWVKFENGASLVQLITGMIYEGPQLIAQINRDLSQKLEEKGLKNISQVVGSAV